MNGAQDLGGMMGFGPVRAEPNEPVFHADWEKRVLGVTLCCAALGEWNIDISRHARESLHPADYLTSSYYEIWLKGLLKLLAANGLVQPEEVEAGRSLQPPRQTARPRMPADAVPSTLARGSGCERPVETAARFKAGDRVRSLNVHPTGHTRLPRYARGKMGVVERVRGGFVFPDSNAHGLGENPQWLYSVVFTGTELWGAGAEPGLTIALDCWEPYLERA